MEKREKATDDGEETRGTKTQERTTEHGLRHESKNTDEARTATQAKLGTLWDIIHEWRPCYGEYVFALRTFSYVIIVGNYCTVSSLLLYLVIVTCSLANGCDVNRVAV